MIGVVHFDDFEQPDSGWACCLNHKSSEVFRIRSPGDLSTDKIWVANLGFNHFTKHLASFPHIKRNTYFRTNIKYIADELGCSIPYNNVSETVKQTALIVGHIAELAHKHWGFRAADLNYDTFAECLRKLILRPDPPLNLELKAILAQAYQGDSKCHGQIPKGSKYSCFWRSRIRHSLDILRCAIPAPSWRLLTKKDFPTQNTLQWLSALKQPALAQISLTSEPSVANLIAFGSTNIGIIKTKLRQWAPLNELENLAPYCDIEISNIYLGEGYESEIPLRMPLPPIHINSWFSISEGLLWENIWTALATPTTGVTKFSSIEYSARAVWLRAQDRMSCFEIALPFFKNNFHVSQYGHGSVSLFLQPGETSSAILCANENRLLAAISTVIDKTAEKMLGD